METTNLDFLKVRFQMVSYKSRTGFEPGLRMNVYLNLMHALTNSATKAGLIPTVIYSIIKHTFLNVGPPKESIFLTPFPKGWEHEIY